jgi:hypothetical protein
MLMNAIGFAVLAGAVLSSPAASSSSRADFGGTWIPDLNTHQRTREPMTREAAELPQTSAQGGGVLFLPPLRIRDDGSTLMFESLGDDSRVLDTVKITTDGKEEAAPLGSGGPIRKSRSNRGGRSVKTQWRQAGAGDLVTTTGTAEWTLSRDGNTLTHETTSEDANWRNRTKTTYKRK